MKTNRSENEWNPIKLQWMPSIKLNQELNLKTRKMKNLILLPILILLICTTSCSDDDNTLFGSGNLTTESRTVNTFTKIQSEGVIDVTIKQGTSQSIEVTSDDNVINQVVTIVNNGELELKLDDDYNFRNISVSVTITLNSLERLRNFGVGDISIEDMDSVTNFFIENEGTGDIEIDGGSTGLTIRNQGSGNILGFNFQVNDCTIDNVGSGDIEINCSDNLDVNIEGSGNVYYKGYPTINTSITGSGSVLNSN